MRRCVFYLAAATVLVIFQGDSSRVRATAATKDALVTSITRQLKTFLKDAGDFGHFEVRRGKGYFCGSGGLINKMNTIVADGSELNTFVDTASLHITYSIQHLEITFTDFYVQSRGLSLTIDRTKRGTFIAECENVEAELKVDLPPSLDTSWPSLEIKDFKVTKIGSIKVTVKVDSNLRRHYTEAAVDVAFKTNIERLKEKIERYVLTKIWEENPAPNGALYLDHSIRVLIDARRDFDYVSEKFNKHCFMGDYRRPKEDGTFYVTRAPKVSYDANILS